MSTTVLEPSATPSRRVMLIVSLGFAVLACVSMGARIDRLGAVGDFWDMVSGFQDGTIHFWEMDTTRPINSLIWSGLWHVFGYRFAGYYVTLIAIQTLTTILFWIILWRYFALHWALSSLTAALVLLYPSNSTRIYIASLTCYLQFWLLAALLWLEMRRAKGYRRALLGTGCFFALFVQSMIYEGQLGLGLIVPVMVLLHQLHNFALRRIIKHEWRALVLWYGSYIPFVFYRAVIEPTLAYVHHPQATELAFSPSHIIQALSAWLNAALWKGWFYTPVVIDTVIDSWLVILGVILGLGAICLLLWQRVPHDTARTAEKMILAGVILLVASAFPYTVTTLDLSATVGSLFGRWLAAAAYGHSLIVMGLILWLYTHVRITIASAVTTLLLSLALLASIGLQAIYADVWMSQVQFIAALDTYAPRLASNTTIVLLDVPSGAYDLRYAGPYTRIARIFYMDETIQVAPWLVQFSPEEQLVVFGQDALHIVTSLEVGQMPTITRPYNRVIAFQFTDAGEVRPTITIPDVYLLEHGSTWRIDPSIEGRTTSLSLASPDKWPQRAMPIRASSSRGQLIGYCQRLLGACPAGSAAQ